MTRPLPWITLASLVCLAIYLFVTAPPPLEACASRTLELPVERMFEIMEAENDAARLLWTKDIVDPGRRAGLKFSEDWREPKSEAGPLPALFLRETARSLEKQPTRLTLFLGSDQPINPANRFEGLQLEVFEAVKRTREAQFFELPELQLKVAMFPDVAVSEACVQCHNDHERSPKHDWAVNDVMGATTWMYPSATVPPEEILRNVSALHQGFRDAYVAYVDRARGFAEPLVFGDQWPSAGRFMPTPELFMEELGRRTAHPTLAALRRLIETSSPGAALEVEANASSR